MNEVPNEYKQEWQETTQELQEASLEVNRANTRYSQAVLARIALRRRIEHGII